MQGRHSRRRHAVVRCQCRDSPRNAESRSSVNRCFLVGCVRCVHSICRVPCDCEGNAMGHDGGARWQQTGPRPVAPHQPELSSGSAWKGFRVRQGRARSLGEINDVAPMNHIVWLVTRGSNAVEGAWRGERWRRTSFPNSVSIVPANTPLSLRWRGETEFIEVELEKGFLRSRYCR